MTDFHHISLRRPAKDVEIPAAYLIEEEEDDYCSYEAPKWPQQQVARPSIAFLVANYAPPMTKPTPLDPRWPKEAAENKAATKIAAEAVAAAEIAYKKKSGELAEAEAASKSVNKWSASRTTSAALIKRLQGEAAELAEKKKAAVASFEKIFKAGDSARWFIENQAKREKLWADYKRVIHEGWEAEFGKHYPRRTTTDLFGYYDVVEKPEEFGDGWTKFVFKAGTDVRHICRELDMGGHDRTKCSEGYSVDEKPWVEVLTAVLKEFESP
jgi:hypothetical protein